MKTIVNLFLKFILLSFVLSFTGCPQLGEPTGDATLTVVNNSEKSIYYYFHIDSLIVDNIPYHFNDPSDFLKPHGTEKIHDWWLQSFKECSLQRLFLFDKEVVVHVPWDTIKTYNMYLKRIDFTKKMLDSLNWILTYP